MPNARFLDRTDLDVTDAAAVRERLRGARVIVHLAAWTRVDECELDPGRALRVNGVGTANVVDAGAEQGARVVYVSTDYVFDGAKATEYDEADETHPLNAYGASKLEGERAAARLDSCLTVRTSWVFGPGHNFVATILAAARAGKPLRVVDDQVGRPTWARPLAHALGELVESDRAGIVHVAGDGPPCSWADLADASLEAAGIGQRVERVDTRTYAGIAPRPLAPRPPNSALALDRARAWGMTLGDWRDSVRSYVGEMS